jgi:hypothetical protein
VEILLAASVGLNAGLVICLYMTSDLLRFEREWRQDQRQECEVWFGRATAKRESENDG